MKCVPITNYVSKEQLENLKVGEQIVITTKASGNKFRIKKTNESERCFTFYCLTTKCSICSRCKINYILESEVVE